MSAENKAPAGDQPPATPPEPKTGGRASAGGPAAGNEQAGALLSALTLTHSFRPRDLAPVANLSR